MRLVDADALYEQLKQDEEMARNRVLDTESSLPYPNNLNPSYTRYVAQMDERTRLKHMVADAPTIEPEQDWIPISETVDVPEDEVLACDKYGTELIGFICEKDEQWMCESDECIMYDVVAWQPLPSPYTQE